MDVVDHNQLDSIRQDASKPPRHEAETFKILQLDSEPDDETIRAHLIQSAFSSDIEYHAISYAWGSQAAESGIHVDGEIIAVTPHLEAGIRQVSKSLGTKFLWVDCLCINQADPVEKARQVAKMHLIFAEAKSVAVWLGIGDASSDMVMQFMAKHSRSLNDAVSTANVSYMAPNATPWLGSLILNDALVKSVFKLSERGWFRRIWCVQEMILAQQINFICGTQVVKEQIFCAFADGIVASRVMLVSTSHLGRELVMPQQLESNILGYTLLKDLAYLRKAFRAHSAIRSSPGFFLSMVYNAQKRFATDSRDRIYGLLGLDSTPGSLFRQGIKVNYSEETKDDQRSLYCEYGKVGILAGEDLHLLRLVSSEVRDDLTDFPSWCPSFDAKPSATALSGSYRCGKLSEKHRCGPENGHRSYTATTSDHVKIVGPGNMLRVRGVLIDTITTLGPTFPLEVASVSEGLLMETESLAPMLKILLDFVTSAQEFIHDTQKQAASNTSTSPQQLMQMKEIRRTTADEAWRALVGDVDLVGNFPASPTTEEAITALPKYLKATLQVESLPKLSRWPWKRKKQLKIQYGLGREQKLSTLVMQRLSELWFGRVLFRTALGRVGLCSTRVRVGDSVVGLYTGTTPYVLRRVRDDTEEIHEFVSDAFVHGSMDGQVFELLDKGWTQEQWFTIR